MKNTLLISTVMCAASLMTACDYQPRTPITDSVYSEVQETPKYHMTAVERYAKQFVEDNPLEHENSVLSEERSKKFQKEFSNELKRNPHLLDSTLFEFQCFGETRNGAYPIRLQDHSAYIKGLVVLLLDRNMAIKIDEKTTKFLRFRGRFVKALSSEAYDYYFPYEALYLSDLGYGINKHGTACFSPLLVKADTIWFE